MSNSLVRRDGGNSIDRASGRNLPARLERAVRGEIDLMQGRAIVQTARTQAVEYAAHSALRAVEGLTDIEALALHRNPLGDARYKAIVDTATGALARIVAETGRPDMGGLLIFLLLVGLAAGLIWLGYRLAKDRLAAKETGLDIQREALRVEWHGLEQARRVNDMFVVARDAIR